MGPTGETTLIRLPTTTPRRLANSLPRMMPGFGLVWAEAPEGSALGGRRTARSCTVPDFTFLVISVTSGSLSGSMPRRTTPRTPVFDVSSTCW